MSTTLVLNADAAPMSIVPLSTVSWQDAVRIIYLDRASVLEEYNRWVIRSPSVQMRMPSVIMLREYRDHDGNVEFSRHNVYLRDNYTCQYCSKKFAHDELTFDHVIPRKNGGKTVFDNILTACAACNQEKGHEHRKSIRRAFHPSYWDLAKNAKGLPIVVPHEAWTLYLGWNAEVSVNENLRNVNIAEDDFDLDLLLL